MGMVRWTWGERHGSEVEQEPLGGEAAGTSHFRNHHLKAIQGTIVKGINRDPITKAASHVEYKQE